MSKGNILIVDDERSILESLEGILSDEGYKVMKAEDGAHAMDMLKAGNPDLILLDIWMPGMDGIETMQAIREFRRDIEVIIMSGHGNIESAVKATKLGAFDYIEKPLSLESVVQTVKEAIAHQRLHREEKVSREPPPQPEDILGTNPKVEANRLLVAEIGPTDQPILLLGEPGTGKEFLARVIHATKQRPGPFVKLNCAVTPEESIEAVLFGEAPSEGPSRAGRLDEADRGTLFLDDFDYLPEECQIKLVELIKHGRFQRAGSKEHVGIKVRVIAASTMDLAGEKRPGGPRPALLKLLSKGTIRIPPLKDRKEDISALAKAFLTSLSREYGKPPKSLEDKALAALVNHHWPGNIKELKNILERLVITVPLEKIAYDDIPPSIRGEERLTERVAFEGYASFKEARQAWERAFISHHLRKHDWDLESAAKAIRVSPSSLEKKIASRGITPGPERVDAGRQRTLRRSVVLCGQGLHSGLKTGLILTPMPPDSGIHFGNISTGETVPALLDYVEKTEYATTLKRNKATARTIEHILAALHAYRVTNLLIKIADEVPIMDGSASDFCQIIEDGGIEEQDEGLVELVVKEPVEHIAEDDVYIRIEPAEELTIEYTLEYPPPVGRQYFKYTYQGPEHFRQNIAPARTFGFLKDIEKLEKMGLASGGRLDNVILIDDEKVINTELRFPDEFVRHKILDIIGDLYLLGRPVRGRIIAVKTGHNENIALLQRLRHLAA
jgi:two-component system nitrogen regulation response regulator NtrX